MPRLKVARRVIWCYRERDLAVTHVPAEQRSGDGSLVLCTHPNPPAREAGGGFHRRAMAHIVLLWVGIMRFKDSPTKHNKCTNAQAPKIWCG